jgi:TonB family protein
MQGLNMKSSVSVALVLLLAFSTFGQTFSTNWEKVPRSFIGNDFETIYDSLLLSRKFFQKDEFETTAKYDERINNPVNIRLGSNLTAANTLVFIYKPSQNHLPTDVFTDNSLSAEYNADREVLSVRIPTKSFYHYEDIFAANAVKSQFFGTAVKLSTLKSEGFYVGENAFGVKRNIQIFRGSSFSLVVANINDLFQPHYASTPLLKMEFKLSPAQARLVKNNLAVAYVTQITSPYLGMDTTELKPTIDGPSDIKIYHKFLVGNLIEVWLFNRIDGTIYSKRKVRQNSDSNVSNLTAKPTPEVELPTPQPTSEPTPQFTPEPTPRVISKGVLNGSATQLVKPVYPPAAKAVRATGSVNVQVSLDELGNVVSASAISGHPLLQQAAVAAARQCKFAPTILSGEAVRVTGIIVFVFP